MIRRWQVLAAAWIAALSVGIAACGPTPEPAPAPFRQTPGGVLLLTPSTVPLVPLEEGPAIRDPGLGEVGVSNLTQAALPAEGQPESDLPTVTPQATLATLPMPVGASDGLLLYGVYYSAPRRPAPGVLLLHMGERDHTSWAPLLAELQGAGYAALAIDLRGFGRTGGAADWTLARQDTAAALAQLAQLPGVDPARLIVIGAGIGANLGLNACAEAGGCAAAILLSPGLDYLGVTAIDALARLGPRPLLIVSGENDDNNPGDSVTLDSLASGPHRLEIVPVKAHGTDLLSADPDLARRIAEWLASQVPPPALES